MKGKVGMKIKTITLIICCFIVFLTSCGIFSKDSKDNRIQNISPVNKDTSNASTVPENTAAPAISNSIPLINEYNENCALQLGLSREKVKLKLKELKIEIAKEYEGKDDNDNPNGLWFIYTKDLELCFNIENQLSQVYINGNLPTKAGLKKGDTLQKMLDLYGKENSYDSGWGMYTYKMKNCSFGIIYDTGNNTVDSWTIFLAD